jgi:hypothetical protein
MLLWMRLVIVALAAAFSAAAQTDSLLNYSITGSSNSSSPAENAAKAMDHLEVQRLLLAVASSPRDRGYVEAALRGSGVSLDDMVSNGSLRVDGGRYWLNFGLLTRGDQEILVRAANTYSQRLADAVLKRRPKIEALLKGYDLDRKAAAFIALGCFSFDWDGLNYATAKGYRAKPPKRKSGSFFFMAEERGGVSLKQIYWGSSNNAYAKYGFTTFGDHFSQKDSTLWNVRRQGPVEWRNQPIAEFAPKVGALMFALHEGPQPADADGLLEAMVKIGWVRKEEGLYRAAIPVLTERDRAMVTGLLRIGRKALEEWFAANYSELKSALADISPVRNRVPFPMAFDQIWHYLFGIANQKLVEAGLFADPYAPDTAFQGYIPAVYVQGMGWLREGL